jgi:hypothetical protein
MNKILKLLPLLLMLFCASTSFAEEPFDSGADGNKLVTDYNELKDIWDENIEVRGHIKNFFMAIDPPDIKGYSDIPGAPEYNDDMLEGIVQSKLRLMFLINPMDKVNIELAYMMAPTVEGDNSDVNQMIVEGMGGLFDDEQLFTPKAYRVDDIDQNLYPEDGETIESFYIVQNLDRAVLTLSPEFGDIYIGRQPVSFGSARTINPTDVIAPYNFNELDTEYQQGVDAIRIKVPIGMMGEFDMGVIFGNDAKWENGAAFVRTQFPVDKYSIALMVMDFRENLMAGIDVTGSVGQAGFWVEASYVWTDYFGEDEVDENLAMILPYLDFDEDEEYFRASVGMDYNISVRNGVYVFLEYHYNGASEGDPDKYLGQFFETAYDEGGVYLLGQNYLVPGASFQITPLLSFAGSTLFNLDDWSYYSLPSFEYSYSDNVYISVGAGIASGKEIEIDVDAIMAGDIEMPIKSEFGMYQSFYYFSIRLYF